MIRTFAIALLVLSVLGLATPANAADDYTIDDNHSSVSFTVDHLGLSQVHGRFDDVSGGFSLDTADPTRSSFTLTLKADSIDTNNKKRDDHLRGEDFFNVKQFPTISFKSTAIKTVKAGYEVTGDLTMHGVTKPVTLTLAGGKSAEFPKGVQRTGFTTALTIKRSDFGMDKFPPPGIGDDIAVSISFEGVKK